MIGRIRGIDDSPQRRSEAMGELGAKTFTTFVSELDERGIRRFWRLRAHLSRCIQSAETLGIYTHSPGGLIEELESYIVTKLTERHEQRTIVRVVIASDGAVVCMEPYVRPWRLDEPLSVISLIGERAMPEHKTTSAVTSWWARQCAVRAGTHEALLLDCDGILREGAWSNVAWLQDGQLYTTERKVLPGIVRAFLIEECGATLVDSSLQQVHVSADAVFITQATTGISLVEKIDGRKVGNARGAAIVGELQQRWQGAYDR